MRKRRVQSPLHLCAGLAALGTSTALVSVPPSANLQHVAFYRGRYTFTCSSASCQWGTGIHTQVFLGVRHSRKARKLSMAMGTPTSQQQRRDRGDASMLLRATVNRTERGLRLRALNWVKQVRSDLTSAEFALNLGETPTARGEKSQVEGEGEGQSAGSNGWGGSSGGGGGGSQLPVIDFEGIAERLEATLELMSRGGPVAVLEALPSEEVKELRQRLQINLEKLRQRAALEGGVSGGPKSKEWRKESTMVEEGRLKMDLTSIKGIKSNLKDVKVPEFDLFVRDDGTVDWDGAIQSGREVARFGQELWDRINGQNPHEEEVGGGALLGGIDKPKQLPEDWPVMLEMQSVEIQLEEMALQMLKEKESLQAQARVNEAVWQPSDRRRANHDIRDKELQLANTERRLQLHRIDMDMERMCFLIEQDIKESSTPPSDNRLLVAEYGLLDAQLSNLKRLVPPTGLNGLSGHGTSSSSGVGDAGAGGAVVLDGIINQGSSSGDWVVGGEGMKGNNLEGIDDPNEVMLDDDELELIGREVMDLKQRLGIDLEKPALSVDPEKIIRYFRDTAEKIRSGLDFYVTGTKLLRNDVVYGLSLVLKAAQGSTLKPREVRTLRRTGKDCLTFIPFIVILIIPLTPVGHVLIFSFIQRFFPDFFPSPYTDRRQNLLRMYEEVEKKSAWEEGDSDDNSEDPLEKLRRKFIATLNNSNLVNDKKSSR